MSTEPLNRSLTPTEQKVLSLIGRGRTSKEVADLLRMSVLTVGNHRKSICRKLNVHSTAELAASGAAVFVTGYTPPLGTPCTLTFFSTVDGSRVQLSYRGRLTAKGGSVRVSIGDFSFTF
jgi:DNA-binding CsgD family transcriptional regulator